MIDLSQATVLPGLVDAHSHIYNNRRPNMTTERSALIAINNAQADLRAGFTAMRDMGSHGNGYGDVDIRDAINWGDIDGPRLQVAGRGIAWGPRPADPASPPSPLASIVIRSAEEARAAVREHVDRGVDWIKLYPTGGYSFTATGEAEYVLTYPLPVLQALSTRPIVSARRPPATPLAAKGSRTHHGWLRHHRARLRPDATAARYDGGRNSSRSTRRSCATPSRTWTTTTRRTPAASSG